MKSKMSVAAVCAMLMVGPMAANAQTVRTITTGGGGGGGGGGGDITTTQTNTTTIPSSSATTSGSTDVSGGSTSSSTQSSSSSQSQNIQVPTLTIKSTNSGAGSATSWPSNTNILTPWYGDALSMGLASQWTNGPPKSTTQITGSKATFGKGIYVPTATATAGTAATTATQANGFTTYGIPRNPSYTTGLSDDVPMIVHADSALQNTIKSAIDRSSRLKSKAGIQVVVKGAAVELRGAVDSDRERLLVEGMVRMTPGVRDVINDLKVATK